MKFIQPFLLLSFLFTLSLWSATPVPYSGKIDIRGVNYFGEAQFAFSLHDGNGTTHWRNGNQPKETIKVTIRNGRYNVLLGGQGMNSLPAELFLNHDKLYLKVEVDIGDGEGLRHLAPDQLITATPRALVAEVAKVAQVAEKVGNGAITRDMLSSEVLAQLDANVTASPSAPVTITRDMLPQDVRDDLNKTVTITRSMLPADVLADLNKSSTTASPITLSMLAPEVTAKLDQNGSGGNTTFYNPPVVGSTLAVPHGQNAPAGYSLYHQVGQPKELVWEEKASVSVARMAFDGVEVLGNKIYFIGGWSGNREKLLERYDPLNDSWETLTPMNQVREAMTASLNGKIYAIGGRGYSGNPLSSVEIYDPVTNSWSNGVSLPSAVEFGVAIAMSQKIFLIGGKNASGQNLNQVLCYDPSSNQWIAKANMPTARCDHKLVWFENRIWAIGGHDGTNSKKVESYDPLTDSWQTEASLTTARRMPTAWIADGRIYVGGGNNGSPISSIEVYDHRTNLWTNAGNFPENKYAAGAVVLNNKVYVIAGQRASGVFSNKVFAADLNASVAGVYDLYRKDGNASSGTPIVQAEVADGSVTTAKLDSTILKYLKPEITSQPQAQTVYGDSNVSFSVIAEGKYLSYQWKKDGLDLVGETNATLTITDANATLHDGNYSVVVSNDFGSVESEKVEVKVSDALQNGLFAWYPLDQNASDMSGNGNHGTPQNTPEFVTNNGKSFVTLQGSGVSTSNGDHILLPHNSFTNLTKISISGWINFESNSYDQNDWAGLIILGEYYSGRFSIYVRSGGGTISFGQKIGEFLLETETGWNSFTVTSNEESTKLYYNGELKNLSSDPYAGFSGSVAAIGRHWWSGSTATRLNGSIDDVRIYDRALSAAEVQALYNMGQ